MSPFRIPVDDNGNPLHVVRLGASQKVTIGGSSQQSQVIGSRMVRLCAMNTGCHVVIGTNPTATVNATYLPADQSESFEVPNPGVSRVAVIDMAGGTGGSLCVTELGVNP